MSRPVKLTLRMDSDLIESAKEYASQHGTSLSRMVAAFFGRLTEEAETGEDPFVERLRKRGALDVSEEAVRDYLARKHDPTG